MSGRIDVGAAQHQGSRDYQEDAFAFLGPGPDGSLSMLLADGMGGHAGGREAATGAIEAARDVLADTGPDAGVDLKVVLHTAKDAVRALHQARPEFIEGGCTFVAATLGPEGLDWVSVGDSPLFLVSSGKVMRLNADHSMAPVLEALVEAGRMDREELATHPQINALRSVIGSEDISLIDRPGEPISLKPGEVIILASDGICTLTREELAETVLRHQGSMSALAEGLVDAVLGKGLKNQDNVTVICSRIVSEETGSATRRVTGGRFAADPARRSDQRRHLTALIVLLVILVLASFGSVFYLLKRPPSPVEPAPVAPIPVEPTPVEPGPVEPGPVEPGPVEPGPVEGRSKTAGPTQDAASPGSAAGPAAAPVSSSAAPSRETAPEPDPAAAVEQNIEEDAGGTPPAAEGTDTGSDPEPVSDVSAEGQPADLRPARRSMEPSPSVEDMVPDEQPVEPGRD